MLPFTLQQLRILKSVALEKNFTKAAKLIYLSQPTISKQIKILEENLGISLFNREKNKISLTENGKILLQYSERILALCEESCRSLVDLKNGERGTLKIGTSPIIGIYLMPKLLTLFNRSYPQINLKILINLTPITFKSIINKQVDIAIVDDETPNEFKKNLNLETFVEDEFKLIISKSHPFATKKNFLKDDLYHLNFLTLNSDSSIKKFIDNVLVQNNVDTKQLKVIMQLNSIEGIKTAVSLGLGAAFLSSSSIIKETEIQTIKILDIENFQMSQIISVISDPLCEKSKNFKFFYNDLKKLKKTLEN
jgi:DNA-binding transcriptional LysR family regulator